MASVSESASRVSLAAALLQALRRELLRLADAEDQLAAGEAARVPYWSPCPSSVIGHRTAARVLREDADRLLQTVAA